MKKLLYTLLCVSTLNISWAQHPIDTTLLAKFSDEAWNNSQLETLGMQLMDDIGPRLMGTPQMIHANEWVMNTYKSWGIESWTEQYGTWRGWERGSTHVRMTKPYNLDLFAMQLAWCPATPKPVQAEVVRIPIVNDSLEFVQWLKTIKGKIVMISNPEYSGRPDENWKSNALEEDYKAYQERKKAHNERWADNMKRIGISPRELIGVIENAGAAAIVSSTWAGGWGALRVMAGRTKKIPHVGLSVEHYNLLWRFLERDIQPRLSIMTQSKDLGPLPAMNTIARIQGKEKPDEIVFLSAHLDSWDAGSGATDNGTGTILMMEVMRILKKHYPQPKRTIMVGHWGGEEQGLNGSRAFVADHPELMDKISVLFNQDNGTGRINWISGNGFLHAYDYFRRWMSFLPETNRSEIKTDFPGSPGRGNSDYASFLAAGVPAFFLLSHGWDYGSYTWHTHLDTYDKVVFDEIRRNAETIAYFVYLACEEPEMFSRERARLPYNYRTGSYAEWPKPTEPDRTGN